MPAGFMAFAQVAIAGLLVIGCSIPRAPKESPAVAFRPSTARQYRWLTAHCASLGAGNDSGVSRPV
jgi:hypothetical protein